MLSNEHLKLLLQAVAIVLALHFAKGSMTGQYRNLMAVGLVAVVLVVVNHLFAEYEGAVIFGTPGGLLYREEEYEEYKKCNEKYEPINKQFEKIQSKRNEFIDSKQYYNNPTPEQKKIVKKFDELNDKRNSILTENQCEKKMIDYENLCELEAMRAARRFAHTRNNACLSGKGF